MSTDFSGVVIVQVKGVTVVTVHMRSVMDDLDIQRLAETFYELVDEKAVRKLVVDFRAVDHMASQILSVLLSLNGKIHAIDGKLIICGLRPGPMRLFTFAPDEAQSMRQFQLVCA